MSILFYQYKNCSTCQKARKYLDRNNVTYEDRAIVENPPSLTDLKKMLSYLKKNGGSFKNLFNTSGVVCREMKISDQLKNGLSEGEALQLLSQNGKLIKRPFLLTSNGGSVGFKEKDWQDLLGL